MKRRSALGWFLLFFPAMGCPASDDLHVEVYLEHRCAVELVSASHADTSLYDITSLEGRTQYRVSVAEVPDRILDATPISVRRPEGRTLGSLYLGFEEQQPTLHVYYREARSRQNSPLGRHRAKGRFTVGDVARFWDPDASVEMTFQGTQASLLASEVLVLWDRVFSQMVRSDSRSDLWNVVDPLPEEVAFRLTGNAAQLTMRWDRIEIRMPWTAPPEAGFDSYQSYTPDHN